MRTYIIIWKVTLSITDGRVSLFSAHPAAMATEALLKTDDDVQKSLIRPGGRFACLYGVYQSGLFKIDARKVKFKKRKYHKRGNRRSKT